jgi:hypothetical protein
MNFIRYWPALIVFTFAFNLGWWFAFDEEKQFASTPAYEHESEVSNQELDLDLEQVEALFNQENSAEFASEEPYQWTYFHREGKDGVPDFDLTSPETCTEKSLFDNKPYVQKIRDQKATGWCYSFGAADLLSYHEGKRMSAVGLASSLIQLRRTRGAVGEKLAKWSLVKALSKRVNLEPAAEQIEEDNQEYDHLIDGAAFFTTPLLGSWRDGGFCYESELNDEALMTLIRIIKSDPSWYHLFQRIRVLPYAESAKYQGEGAHGTAPIVKVKGKAPEVKSEAEAHKELQALLKRSGFTDEQIKKLAQLSNMKTTEPLKEYKKLLCPNPHKLSFNWLRFSYQSALPIKFEGGFPKFQRRNLTLPMRYLSEAHKALNRNSPFTMAYDVGAIRPGDKRGLGHISIVAGRRWNKERKECEFLVKNSWGQGGDYVKGKATALEANWKGHPGDWRGYYWLPETSFLDAMTDGSLLKPRKDGKINWTGELYWLNGRK